MASQTRSKHRFNIIHAFTLLKAAPSSAYSLSGVVTISVSSPYSLFERRRTAKLLLQSLSLTFEGQSEIFTHEYPENKVPPAHGGYV